MKGKKGRKRKARKEKENNGCPLPPKRENKVRSQDAAAVCHFLLQITKMCTFNVVDKCPKWAASLKILFLDQKKKEEEEESRNGMYEDV